MDEKNRLILIDGNSLANRAFYALPMLTSADGRPAGAVYGFANMLIRMIEDYSPKYIAVAFDMKAPTFRHNMYDGYKATRKGMPDELASQMPLLKEMLSLMGIKCVQQEGIEADDIIGTMAKTSGVPTLIVTGDRDSFQLIDDNITVLYTKRGITEVEVMDASALMDKYGLTPKQIIDYKALAGDSSDNIPGVAGIGDKRATELLQKYADIEGVYAHIDELKGKQKENLAAGRHMCELSYTLATIKTDCELSTVKEECSYSFPFSGGVKKFFQSLDFKSLVKRSELFVSDDDSGVSGVESEEDRAAELVELRDAKELTEALKGVKAFAMTITDEEIAFSTDGIKQFSLSISGDLLAMATGEGDILKAVKPLLASEEITKYLFDAKAMLKIAAKYGIDISGYEDVALMQYLASRASDSVKDFALTCGYEEKYTALAVFNAYNSLKMNLDGQNMTKLYRDMELPLVRVLFEMEREGFILDMTLLANLNQKYTAAESETAKRIYELSGKEFNINSPKQLAEVLFEELAIPYPKKSKTRSTSAEILHLIENKHPVISEILRYRFITKLKSTYIDGLGRMADKSGRVHTEFNQMQTTTGRLSSSEPNLQNIPVREEEGKALRGLFIANEGHSLVAADYSQIELRVMAHLSGDEALIRAYQNGEDIHTSVACELFDTKSPTDKERRVAKTVNFGIIYGMSAFGLSERLGIPPQKAKEYIDKYFEKYVGVKEYLDSVVKQAKESGYAESLFGRRRVIPELKSTNFQQRSFGERAAMNMPLQSTAADIIKVAMLRVHEALKGTQAKLILQVHDELIIDTPEELAEQTAEVLKREMENAVQLKVPLVADVKTGKSWLECK